MKKLTLLLSVLLSATSLMSAEYEVKSPDGKLSAKVVDGEILKFSVSADGKKMLEDCAISMSTDKGELGVNALVKSSKPTSNTGYIDTVYGTKNRVSDNFNQLELDFGKYTLFVRAYNDAVAYRFATRFDGEMIVKNECLELSSLKAKDKVIAHVVKEVKDSFESPYTRGTADMMKSEHSATLPFIFEKEGMKVALVQSAWSDYPALRIAWNKNTSKLSSFFAKTPKELGYNFNPKAWSVERYGMLIVKKEENYIAKTKGTRVFPWRAFVVARNDIDLVDNDTVFRLAEPSKIADTSWIKTGTAVWDWWVCWLTEDSDFDIGINDDMYKYYVDFASENKIPFVVVDAGWNTGFRAFGEIAYKPENYMLEKPVVDIQGLVKYGNKKGVKIIIWVPSQVFYFYPEKALETFKKWGVAGMKIDYSNRDDQMIIQLIEKISHRASELGLLIDWHGCPVLPGFQRTYPNVINFEGVFGGEMNKFGKPCTPSHNVDLLFTRMLMGPMDYTSGGMRNCTNNTWVKSYAQPYVQGTRAHMLSHYVLFNEPLKMLSDMPSEYRKYPEQLKFMAEVPTSWDESKVLDGKIGEYVVVARRKGDVWYIAGMSDWNGKSVEIDLSKILSKKIYEAEIFTDSVNANKIATDCKRELKNVRNTDTIKILMKSGGGFVIKLSPRNFWFF